MVVYADVLIILNLIVDYFLLKLTSVIVRSKPILWRLLLASFFGALTSLYIFLPPAPAVIETPVKLVFCIAMTLICFGFGGLNVFLRRLLTLFAVTFAFAGAMMGVWYIFKPSGMVINNSVVYFNISPLFLILFSVAGYFLSAFLRRLFSKNQIEEVCRIEITAGEKTVEAQALVDTGNSLSDPFGDSEIIITDKTVADALFEGQDRDKRYRAIPCVTVSGTVLLEGYRCDRAQITQKEQKTVLVKPIIAISNTKIKGDFKAIINPQSIGL